MTIDWKKLDWNLPAGDWVRARQLFQRFASIVFPSLRKSIDDTTSVANSAYTRATSVYMADIPMLTNIDFTYSEGQVTWTSGQVVYKGEIYAIDSQPTPVTAGWVYWDVEATSFSYDILAPAITDDRWIFYVIHDGQASRVTQYNLLNVGLLQAGMITGTYIATGTLESTNLLLNNTMGGAIAGCISGAGQTVKIAAKNIEISGSTTFSSDWTSASNSNPAGWTDNTVASAAASTASAAASTASTAQSTANSNTTNKLDKLGGQYNTAASGARVQIFPDANTGIKASNGTTSIFQVLVGGTDIGDVIIGNEGGGKYVKWDNSAGTLAVRGTLTVDDLNAGTYDVIKKNTGTSIADGLLKSADGKIEIDFTNNQIKLITGAGDYVVLTGDGLRVYDASVSAANLRSKVGDCGYAGFDGGIQTEALLCGKFSGTGDNDISSAFLQANARYNTSYSFCALGAYNSTHASNKSIYFYTDSGGTHLFIDNATIDYSTIGSNCTINAPAPSLAVVKQGQYTGNGSNATITHGLGRTPTCIMVRGANSYYYGDVWANSGTVSNTGITTVGATEFTCVNGGLTYNNLTTNTVVYHWIAW